MDWVGLAYYLVVALAGYLARHFNLPPPPIPRIGRDNGQ